MSITFSVEMLFEDAACGLMVTASDGTILKINRTLCQWLGYEATDLLDVKKLQDLFTVGGRFFHYTHWAPLLQIQGSVAEVQMDMVCKSGATIPTLINAKLRKLEVGHFIELAMFVATDRKKYERELLRARQQAEKSLADLKNLQQELQRLNHRLSDADRRKDEFLATLAHELRNPLAPISNVIHIVKRKGVTDPQVKWAMDILDRQVHQLTHLVDDLMDVSRITAGRLRLRKASISLEPILRQAIEGADAIIANAGHTLNLDFPCDTIVIQGDVTRLVQIFSNLIINAAKYTPPGGLISISATANEDSTEVRISDSGIGIATEHLGSVFNMFSQLTPALERAQGGLGIGLALVRGLVELHGGAISAASEGEGKGSTFIVRLPRDKALIAEPALQAVVERTPHAYKILVIDDNDDTARSLATMLDLLGHNVAVANTGAEGVRLFLQSRPQIVLSDIGLPDINGYEVARAIRKQQTGDVWLIAITGWGQDTDKARAIDSGFDYHLTKPIDFAELEKILSSFP